MKKALFNVFGKLALIICLSGTFLTAMSQSSFEALHYQIKWNTLSVFSNGIQAETLLKITGPNNSTNLTLNLLGFTVDSVILAPDQPLSYSRGTSTLLVNLPAIRPDTFELTVYYRGAPQRDETWGGFYVSGNYAYNMGVGMTSIPHNFGRAWFPCFDNFTDRATYQFDVITAADFKAVCSGILIDDTAYSNNTHLWSWKINTPIPTYLAGIAIGKYEFIKYEFTAQNGTIPVWLAAEAKDTTNLRSSFQRLNEAITCFENRFGPYQFERVGYVAVPFNSGAMEHATSIAYPIYAIDGTASYETLMAHELSHHWWGNLATCSTAEDMWLNEGWASYCESLFLECVYGKEAFTKDLTEKRTTVLIDAPKNDGGYLPVSGIPQTVTYGTHVYKKGALMANVLRSYMGDSSFFEACKSYLTNFSFTAVNTVDLRNHFQKFTSVNLTPVFEQFVVQKGHYDLVVGKQFTDSTNQLNIDFYVLNRYKTAPIPDIELPIQLYFSNADPLALNLRLTNGYGTLKLPGQLNLMHAEVNTTEQFAFANTAQQITLKARGLTPLPDQLMIINTQTINDSVSLWVTHHWVGPTSGNLSEQGIRISNERYWSIRGTLPNDFSAWGFFNYDGTTASFLDHELLNGNANEDSLVLLYRKNESSPWQKLTISTEVTYQPGGNPLDKLGRFWVTKIQSGDYALGIKDYKVVGLSQPKLSEINIRIWPNPAKDIINIELQNAAISQPTHIEVYNSIGQLLETHYVQPKVGLLTLPINNWSSGVYYIRGQQANQNFSATFVKP